MRFVSTLDVRSFLASNLSGNDDLIINGAIDRSKATSIGVFSGPESRSISTRAYGGDELTPVKVFPINVLVRWTDDMHVCEQRAQEVYTAFATAGQNFFLVPSDPDSTKVAFFDMLDNYPISLGRDKDNVCEFSVRVNVVFYNN